MGGDITQAQITKRGLAAVGVTADILAKLEPDVRGYDLAHVFGAFDPEICAEQVAACRRSGVRVALSPIWWDLYQFFGRSRACERILAGPARAVEKNSNVCGKPGPPICFARERRTGTGSASPSKRL